jgi:phosphoglycolate phosphatase
MIRNIIWDWNGTLIDDVDAAITAVNGILAARNMPPTTKDRYFEDFKLPIIRYYESLGINFNSEPFENIASEFNASYRLQLPGMKLMRGAAEILEKLKSKGCRQFIISAFQQDDLVELVRDFGIDGYFDEIIGQSNRRAGRKEDMALKWLKRSGIDPKNAMVIGDTVYDNDVAVALGCGCILVSNGHQSRNTLFSCGADVLDDLSGLIEKLEI